MEDGRKAVEKILEEHVSYNTENGILPSETTVCRSLLSRYAELIEAYDELWTKANQSEFQLRVFIDGLLGTAAFWNPAKMAEARRMRAKLEDVNQKISGMAMELAELFEKRAKLHEGLSQIFLVNGLLTTSGEIAAPNVAERSHDSECHCRQAEAPIKGRLQRSAFRGMAHHAGSGLVSALSAQLSRP